MIKKIYEINEKILSINNLFLLYGLNDGAKKELIDKIIKSLNNKNVYKYNEKEVFENLQSFSESIISKSLFDEKKIIIINGCTDKIVDAANTLVEIVDEEIKIIFNAGNLDKKSKLRKLFEKDNNLICIPFYQDDNKTLLSISQKFIAENKISISTHDLNSVVNRCNGDRGILKNELEKIEHYSVTNKKISSDVLFKLTNLIENYSVDELTNNYLAKNKKKILQILNENNYVSEDCIIIIRNLLFKAKKLLQLTKNFSKTNNLNQTINDFKPPIFWKEREIISTQILKWSEPEVKKLIYKIFDIELEIKKDISNSKSLIINFILEDFAKINNYS
ncbi:DNA polymerase III subunit delta [Candidatus Pelagibacter sp. HIMB1521]|uniref:DNA polymerase III subunit delta n=1 Tax=Candidatus Pelagibacter sp. HIMB1521 TaxID=3413344 RepID=UPI003F84E3F0